MLPFASARRGSTPEVEIEQPTRGAFGRSSIGSTAWIERDRRVAGLRYRHTRLAGLRRFGQLSLR